MQTRTRSGFTLVELLLVVVIVVVLIALLFPAFTAARKQARLARCSANLHQLGMAYSMYVNDYGEWPDPARLVRSVRDRRLLNCPEDQRPERAASSYTFRTLIPPDYQPYWEQPDLDPNTVLAVCPQHLEQDEREVGDARQVSPPRYPFELVLRANGAVSRLRQDAVREVFVPGDRPSYSHVYPGELFYTQARR